MKEIFFKVDKKILKTFKTCLMFTRINRMFGKMSSFIFGLNFQKMFNI